ncbi:MAG: flagellar biosynthesis protein FlhB [Vicinamibacterales bacterium]
MAESPTSERTEKPSAKKLREARERGQVPRSRDLSIAAASLAVTIAFDYFGEALLRRLSGRMAIGLSSLGDRPLRTLTPVELTSGLIADATGLALVVGPLVGIAALVGIGTTVAQSGWVLSSTPLQIDWNRLNPATGLARLKPSQSGVDLLKQVVGVSALTVLAYNVTRELVVDAPRLIWLSPAAAASSGWQRLVTLLWRTGFALLALAAADYGIQRWRHWSSLKMTKQEVRDEAKGEGGNPEVKARVRRIQREMTRKRMLGAVKTATVVITNPTHYAVALEYRREVSPAPRVVAKGKDHMAAKIRAAARDAGVPIVENVSLAQALYRGVEVGDTIPADLFGAVAEVLAYLVRIKQLTLQ